MYKDKNLIVEDSFQAYLIEGAKLTKIEQYPIIPNWMISKSIPVNIMPFDKAINYSGDLSNTFICTYARDCTFERVRKNPKKYINFFRRTAGLIGFDYSVHDDMPIIKQKSQMNDNLSLTYFYGHQGVKVIPNIRYGIDELSDEFLEAIPKNSLIAIGTHGFSKTIIQKAEWYCFLEKMLTTLKPSGIIVYGSLKGFIFDDFKNKYSFYFYEPWLKQNLKLRGGFSYGN